MTGRENVQQVESGFNTINPKESIPTAVIFKIDRFSIHDGPGIRTNIYFKGCTLRCLWCSNPQGQRGIRELGFMVRKCIGCGRCVDSCSRGAITIENGKASVDFKKCDRCEECIPKCPTKAIMIYGQKYTLPQVINIMNKDRHIYTQSGGGITCSGGEVFQQEKFLHQLLMKCRELGIHTAVETCGFADELGFKRNLPFINWLFFDLKHIDNAHHRRLTGQSNEIILNNLKTVSSAFLGTGQTLVVRQVIIPGFNNGKQVYDMVDMVKELPFVTMLELLPYHNYGVSSYHSLGRQYQLMEVITPSAEELWEYKNYAESCGIRCKIGGL